MAFWVKGHFGKTSYFALAGCFFSSLLRRRILSFSELIPDKAEAVDDILNRDGLNTRRRPDVKLHLAVDGGLEFGNLMQCICEQLDGHFLSQPFVFEGEGGQASPEFMKEQQL
jgi:hypothetical protein